MHLSEPAAYLRIQAARVSRRCPRVLEALSRGELSLSAVKVLGQNLSPENQAELIRSATQRTVRELEVVLAERPEPQDPEQAVAELWSWYLEWSTIARQVITDRKLLRAMGFLKPQRQGEEEEKDPELPAPAPVPVAPAAPSNGGVAPVPAPSA